MFLPFKTPLSESYSHLIPRAKQFLPQFVFETLNDDQEIGLWIDFTNTDRFYRRWDVENRSVEYVKFRLPGHGVAPREEETYRFIEICEKFFSDNPEKIIAVHCTHGFNRTGFLIAAYLVVKCSFKASEAIRLFRDARPPGIYKQHYLDDFMERYGQKSESPISAPEMPDWDQEDEPSASNDAESKRTDIPQFMDGAVQSVPYVLDPNLRTDVQRTAQKMLGYKGRGFPGSQPVSMEPGNLNFLEEKKYRVSWKADGVRYMMLIRGENEIFLIDRSNNVFLASNLFFPSLPGSHSLHITDTLVDGEMVVDRVQDKSIARYLIYDLIFFQNANFTQKDFDCRLGCVRDSIVKPRNTWIGQGKIDRSSEPFGVRIKDFWDVRQVEKILGEKFQSSLPHEIDGLVFQPVPEAYKPGRCDTVLKWKPHHLNSVDFKLKIVKFQRPGMLPEWIGELYVSGRDSPYDKLTVKRSLMQYDRKIVECSVKVSGDGTAQWEILRERKDKNVPNHISTAEAVMQSIVNPVTKERLIDFCKYRAVK